MIDTFYQLIEYHVKCKHPTVCMQYLLNADVCVCMCMCACAYMYVQINLGVCVCACVGALVWKLLPNI